MAGVCNVLCCCNVFCCCVGGVNDVILPLGVILRRQGVETATIEVPVCQECFTGVFNRASWLPKERADAFHVSP